MGTRFAKPARFSCLPKALTTAFAYATISSFDGIVAHGGAYSMNTSEKAEIATLKVIIRAIEKGAFVSKPVVEGMRYDLVVDYQGRLYRAQVKYADGSSQNGAVFVRLTSSSYGRIRFKGYTAQEVDVVLVYVPKIDAVLWIDPDCFDGKANLNFRLRPAENNQQKGCRSAENYIW